MVNQKIISPYTADSFEKQKELLKDELKYLGVNISKEEAARISFLSRRKYERYDLFFTGESFDNRLINWLEHNFLPIDRQNAYEIIKYLKFISDYEMKELAVQTFENTKRCICARAHAYSVGLGKILEKVVVAHRDFNIPICDCRPLFEPIDLVAFNGLGKGTVDSIDFIEIKTGKAKLSDHEKVVKQAVEDGKVSLKVIK